MIWLVQFAVAGILSAGLPLDALPPSGCPNSPKAAQFLEDLKHEMTINQTAIEKEVASGDVSTYYFTSYYLMGLAEGAEANGDPEAMAHLVGLIDHMLASAKPVRRNNRTYNEFMPLGSDGLPQQLDAFQATAPLARTAAIIRTRPEFKVKFAAAADRIVRFVDESVFQFWFDKTTGVYADPKGHWQGGSIPWLPKDLGGWGSYSSWVDKASHLGAISTWMWQATGDRRYLEFAQRIAEGFHRHVTVVDGCWIWDKGTVQIEAGQNLHGTPDTSHANREPLMVVAMYEAGIEFTLADVQAIATTLVRKIWNQDPSNPMFANYIDGNNALYRNAGPWTNGLLYAGWSAVGRYSTVAEGILETVYGSIRTPQALSTNPSLRSNGSSYGHVAFPGVLARNRAR
jgi:hypothetical protein